MAQITKYDDIIDSRDVMARIAALEEFQADAIENDEPELDDDAQAELQALKVLADEAKGCGAWEYGETLIRDSYFESYAQQLAEDCGMIPEGSTWPMTCIDWDQAARELRMDYTSVNFDGVTYWLRS